MKTRLGVVAALGVLGAALAGCTGVPTSSAPQTIKPIPLENIGSSPPDPPERGIAPLELVSQFLGVNAADASGNSSARLYLTAAASSRWTDNTATIISGERYAFDPRHPVVLVRGSIVGSLSANGIYTPSLQGVGNGAAPAVFEFGIKKVRGEYRIDTLGKGLLLTTAEFPSAYRQHSLYFYDLAGRYLVPDQRWSGLEGTALEEWLVTQLAIGPRPDLQNAVNSDTLPNQATSRTITVKQGVATDIDIRGAQGLDSSARNQLAAQLSFTLSDTTSGAPLLISDGGAPVRIPAANGSEFTASTFERAAGPVTPQPDVYYLRDGKVVNADGTLLVGAVNSGYYLTSVGLERTGASSTLNIAGVEGSGTSERLVVGTQSSGLHPTTIVGALSRPAWVPGSSEVWVGAGRLLYRTTVAADGRPSKPQLIAVPSTAAGEEIVSLRVSPEGSRVAVVLRSADGARQLFVGAVVRRSGQVRIDTLTPISPEGVTITDAAWIDSPEVDSHKLFAIGYPTGSGDARVYETDVDGSLWSSRQFTLPYPPDSVTVTAGHLAWVSSGGFVWLQDNGNWDSPGQQSQTAGTAPVYLE